MKTEYPPRATLGVNRASYDDLMARAKTIHKGIAGHPAIFVTPTPPLVTLETRILALDQAQQDALTRAAGTAAARDLKANEVASTLEGCRAYVQGLVDLTPTRVSRSSRPRGCS